MFRRRNLLVGTALAAVAGTASYLHAQAVEGAVARSHAPVNVVVVTQRVPALQRLEPSLLRLQPVPRGTVLPGAYRSTRAVVGRVTTVPLWPGEQVIAGRTVDADDLEKEAGLKPGERGVTVRVTREIASALRPGNWVDVLAVGGTGGPGRVVSGVRVVDVDTGGGSLADHDPWVMLAVTPAQAQVLAEAEEAGSVRVVLRGGEEKPQVQPHDVTGAAARPPRSSPVRKPGSVEVIRGVDRDS